MLQFTGIVVGLLTQKTKMKRYILIAFLVITGLNPSVLFSQAELSIHIQELLQHRYDVIDFTGIDSIGGLTLQIPERNRTLSAEVIGYLPYWEYEEYPNLRYDLLTQINYFSAEMSSTGTIENLHNWPNLDMIDYAQSQGVVVKLCATLFGNTELTTLLGNPIYRQNAINNLLDAVLDAGADGVDIDFELLPYSQRENMVQFITDLTAVFHAAIPNSIVTMATPAVDWNGSWDYEALANISDGLFIMAYNYHWSGSVTAGPVAPLDGFFYDVGWTIDDYLFYSGGNSEKLILGLPYYGYDWPVADNQIYTPTTGTGTARIYSVASNLAEAYGQSWDEASSTHWISYNSDTWRQCWYDDSLSLSLKYQAAMEAEFAGVGMWALGYDAGTTELWGAIEDQFSSCAPTGDVNLDDTVNVLDVIQIVNNILGNYEFSENQICAGDLNGDLSIDLLDIVMLINMILGN